MDPYTFGILTVVSTAKSVWQKRKAALQNCLNAVEKRHLQKLLSCFDQWIEALADDDKLETIRKLRQVALITTKLISQERVAESFIPNAYRMFQSMSRSFTGPWDLIAIRFLSDTYAFVNQLLDLEFKHHIGSPNYPSEYSLMKRLRLSWPSEDSWDWVRTTLEHLYEFPPFHPHLPPVRARSINSSMVGGIKMYCDLWEARWDLVFDSQQKDKTALTSFVEARQDKKVYKTFSFGVKRDLSEKCSHLRKQMLSQFRKTYGRVLCQIYPAQTDLVTEFHDLWESKDQFSRLDGFLPMLKVSYRTEEERQFSLSVFHNTFLLIRFLLVAKCRLEHVERLVVDAPIISVEVLELHLTLVYAALHKKWISNKYHQRIRNMSRDQASIFLPSFSKLSRMINEVSPVENILSTLEPYFDLKEAQIVEELKLGIEDLDPATLDRLKKAVSQAAGQSD